VSKAPLSRREMFVLCLRDVTERRESEEAMRESAARYRLLVDHAPEAIVVLDVDTGRFVDANDNAQKPLRPRSRAAPPGGAGELESAATARRRRVEQRARAYIQQALEGNTPVFECRTAMPRAARSSARCAWCTCRAATPPGARQHRRHLRAQAQRAHGRRRTQGVRSR